MYFFEKHVSCFLILIKICVTILQYRNRKMKEYSPSIENQNVKGVSFVSETSVLLPSNMSHVFLNLIFLHLSFLLVSIFVVFLLHGLSHSLSCSVKRQRNESDTWATASSRTMNGFPEGPPVLDYREPEPHPKGHKYQHSLKTLIPFRFGSK